jgi:hypothetical protein
VKKLRLLPIKGMPEHLVIEAVLSHLLMVPQAPFSHVYYASIITDLCKLDFKYPVVLAEAIETLYDIVPRMDNEMVDRLSAFFAHVVSNFGYKWFWEDWTGVLETDDIQGGTCKKLFIYEVLLAISSLSPPSPFLYPPELDRRGPGVWWCRSGQCLGGGHQGGTEGAARGHPGGTKGALSGHPVDTKGAPDSND